MRQKNQPIPNKKVKGKTRRNSSKTSQPSNLLGDMEILEEVTKDIETLVPPELNPEMTQSTDLVIIEEDKADLLFTPEEKKALVAYQEARKPELAVETAMSFFQLYLNGYDVAEIHSLNKAFPIEAIHWARLKYSWDDKKGKYISDMHDKIVSKVAKAQLETTNMMTDLLTVTTKKYGDKLKRYLQTGNEKDLGGAIEVQSIAQLLKLLDGLQKVTGQDNTKKHIHDHRITTEETTNVNVTVEGELAGDLREEEAASILSALAAAKRRKDREK